MNPINQGHVLNRNMTAADPLSQARLKTGCETAHSVGIKEGEFGRVI